VELVSVQQPTLPAHDPLRRVRRLVWGGAIVVGVAVATAVLLLQRTPSQTVPVVQVPASSPDNGAAATWRAGVHPAPDFALRDQDGAAVSLARFRGRPVFLTFIDPLCRNLCPTEAKILAKAAAELPPARRPAIVAVSVNRWGNAPRILRQDVAKWSLPQEWRWAVGGDAALARVWKDYSIGVTATSKTVTGVTVHEISHTEAAYLIGPDGSQRALWVYPFRAADLAAAVRSLAGAQS
jgi:cytochrome oxidase Cu insertion factor (SCO1/SenC/PrrC family)